MGVKGGLLLPSKEEHKLQMFKSKVLRKIVGNKNGDVISCIRLTRNFMACTGYLE